MNDFISLAGKTAIITGAAQGLGLGTAEVLAMAGARIAILDLQEEKATQAAESLPGAGHMAYRCDITDSDARAAVLQDLKIKTSSIDILVNNAGIQYHASAEDIEEDGWHQLFNVNLHGVVFMSRDVGRIMLEQGGRSHCQYRQYCICDCHAAPRTLYHRQDCHHRFDPLTCSRLGQPGCSCQCRVSGLSSNGAIR